MQYWKICTATIPLPPARTIPSTHFKTDGMMNPVENTLGTSFQKLACHGINPYHKGRRQSPGGPPHCTSSRAYSSLSRKVAPVYRGIPWRPQARKISRLLIFSKVLKRLCILYRGELVFVDHANRRAWQYPVQIPKATGCTFVKADPDLPSVLLMSDLSCSTPWAFGRSLRGSPMSTDTNCRSNPPNAPRDSLGEMRWDRS